MTLHAEFRTHRVTVSRISRTSDGAGGWTAALAVAGTVEGSLQPSGAADTTVAGAERAEMRWQFYADPDEDISRDDILQVVAVRRFNGWDDVDDPATYRVLSVGVWDDPNAGLDHMNVQVEQVQRGR